MAKEVMRTMTGRAADNPKIRNAKNFLKKTIEKIPEKIKKKKSRKADRLENRILYI